MWAGFEVKTLIFKCKQSFLTLLQITIMWLLCSTFYKTCKYYINNMINFACLHTSRSWGSAFGLVSFDYLETWLMLYGMKMFKVVPTFFLGCSWCDSAQRRHMNNFMIRVQASQLFNKDSSEIYVFGKEYVTGLKVYLDLQQET